MPTLLTIWISIHYFVSQFLIYGQINKQPDHFCKKKTAFGLDKAKKSWTCFGFKGSRCIRFLRFYYVWKSLQNPRKNKKKNGTNNILKMIYCKYYGNNTGLRYVSG